jgi:hypothetical protein
MKAPNVATGQLVGLFPAFGKHGIDQVRGERKNEERRKRGKNEGAPRTREL